MERNYDLELNSICLVNVQFDPTYMSYIGPCAHPIKKMTWQNCSIQSYKGDHGTPFSKLYEDFVVIGIGKEPTFDTEMQCIIKEGLYGTLGLRGYCNEESLAIMVSTRTKCVVTLEKMFRAFFLKEFKVDKSTYDQVIAYPVYPFPVYPF